MRSERAWLAEDDEAPDSGRGPLDGPAWSLAQERLDADELVSVRAVLARVPADPPPRSTCWSVRGARVGARSRLGRPRGAASAQVPDPFDLGELTGAAWHGPVDDEFGHRVVWPVAHYAGAWLLARWEDPVVGRRYGLWVRRDGQFCVLAGPALGRTYVPPGREVVVEDGTGWRFSAVVVAPRPVAGLTWEDLPGRARDVQRLQPEVVRSLVALGQPRSAVAGRPSGRVAPAVVPAR